METTIRELAEFATPQEATSWFYGATIDDCRAINLGQGKGSPNSAMPVILAEIVFGIHSIKPGTIDFALPNYWWGPILEQSNGVLGDNPLRHFVWTYDCEESEGKPYPLTLEAAELLCSLQ
jgi:hypothetical protein